MCGGHNGYGLRAPIVTVLFDGPKDRRIALRHETMVKMREVKHYMIIARPLHLRVYVPCHNIAWAKEP